MLERTEGARQPSQARAVRTRQRVLLAAVQQFSRRGYAATTTKNVAEQAGVATGTVYQYFSDKDALLHEIARSRVREVPRAIVDVIARTAGDTATELEARRQLEGIVSFVIDQHRHEPGLHAVLTERRHADSALDAMVTQSETELVEGIASLLAVWRHPGDHLATAFVLFGMVEGAVHAHVLGHALVDDQRFRAALVGALAAVAWPVRDETPTDSFTQHPR
jgi:AcrR family transcriptional regulator